MPDCQALEVHRAIPALHVVAGDVLVVWPDGLDVVHRVPLDYPALCRALALREVSPVPDDDQPPTSVAHHLRLVES